MGITDNLNSNLSQNFSYDSLNRLSTAQTSGTSGPNCWGQQYGYDAWGNLLTETPNVSGCPTNSLNVGVNANNQITNIGFSYDAAGNLRADGTNTYSFDAENHLTSINSGAATYTYDAEGRRMGKKIGSTNTWYIRFGGDVITEYSVGDQVWNDYIFAGGRRLAAASSDDILDPGFEQGLEGWLAGASDSSGSEQVITDPTRAHSGNNYLQLSSTTAQVMADNEVVAVNPGDQLTFGGWVYLEPGSASAWVSWNLAVRDANGNVLAWPTTGNTTSAAWTYQSLNYTVPSGGASVQLYAQIYQPTGSITARFDDAFLTGASGLGVRYYHADHLDSARLMTDSGGNVTWPATYLPFGQEWNPQATTNHYKFTGLERDSESGLDNALLRKYTSQLGRWMTPDPAGLAAVNTMNPQSWNRYAYVINNPLAYVDPSGMDFCSENNPYTTGGGGTNNLPDPNCIPNGIPNYYKADYNGPVPDWKYFQGQTWQSVDTWFNNQGITEYAPLPTGALNYNPNQGDLGMLGSQEATVGFDHILKAINDDWTRYGLGQNIAWLVLASSPLGGGLPVPDILDALQIDRNVLKDLGAWKAVSVPRAPAVPCVMNAGLAMGVWKGQLLAWLKSHPGQAPPPEIATPPSLSGVCG